MLVYRRVVVGGFNNFFIFTSKIGEDEPNLTSIFFKWVETTTWYKLIDKNKWLVTGIQMISYSSC